MEYDFLCPYCNRKNYIELGDNFDEDDIQQKKCKHCKNKFNYWVSTEINCYTDKIEEQI